MRTGIDVSYAQGVIDWNKVAAAGIDFAVIQAGYGQCGVDSRFAYNISNCNRLGIPVGVYWFSYAKTVQEARQEAAKCLQTIKPYTVDLFIAWDWENDSYAKAVAAGVKPTPALVSGMAEAFLSAIQAAGYSAVNYSNIDYLTQYFGASVTSRWPVWVAQWPSNKLWQWPQTADKSQYTGDHIMWQFGCFTGIPGIGAAVDADIFYEEDFDDMKDMTGEEIYTKLTGYLATLPTSKYARESSEKGVKCKLFADGDKDGLVDNPQGILRRQELAVVLNRVGLLDKKYDTDA